MSDNIRQIAQQHLRKVKTSGNENIMAICPFHRKADGSEEHTPSFAMNIYSGLWLCHSCHARGNLRTFLRDVGISRAEIDAIYSDVLKEAEQHAPLPYDPLHVIEPTKEILPENFLGRFDYCPVDLLNEGYPEELLRKFDVGFDDVHKRITFPLRDLLGRLVGISGRAVADNQGARYKVYDWEYKDFALAERRTEKRAILWNAHNVLPQLVFETDPGDRYVVVTEGFKAVMRVAQAGISNVVGLLASFMSEEQQQYLEKMGCTILLMFDNDLAGQRGCVDAGKRLQKSVPRLFVVKYDGPQPSEIHTQAIIDSLLSAQPFSIWFSQQLRTPQ
jgi:DNA primase